MRVLLFCSDCGKQKEIVIPDDVDPIDHAEMLGWESFPDALVCPTCSYEEGHEYTTQEEGDDGTFKEN
jgi:hypothetical protein